MNEHVFSLKAYYDVSVLNNLYLFFYLLKVIIFFVVVQFLLLMKESFFAIQTYQNNCIVGILLFMVGNLSNIFFLICSLEKDHTSYRKINRILTCLNK